MTLMRSSRPGSRNYTPVGLCGFIAPQGISWAMRGAVCKSDKYWLTIIYNVVIISDHLIASINLPPNTFAHNFLMGLSTQKIPFRYIAPGILLPTVAEFANQSYLGSCPTNDLILLPLPFFYTDDEKGLGYGLYPLSPPPTY